MPSFQRYRLYIYIAIADERACIYCMSIHLHDYQHNRIASNCIAEHDVSLIDARETASGLRGLPKALSVLLSVTNPLIASFTFLNQNCHNGMHAGKMA